MSNGWYMSIPEYHVMESAQVSTDTQVVRNNTEGYKKTVKYYNYTGAKLYVVDRAGFATELPPALDYLPDTESRGLIVVATYELGMHSRAIPRPLLLQDNKVGMVISKITGQLQEKSQYVNGRRTADVKYVIPGNEIHTRATVYLRDLDILVTTITPQPGYGHPYEYAQSQFDSLYRDSDTNEVHTFSLKMKIVNANSVPTKYYLNINGRIYCVRSCRDLKLADGIYLEDSQRVLEGSLTVPTIVHYNTLADYNKACKEDETLLPLYANYETALTYGDLEARRKEEENRLKHEQTLTEQRIKHEQAMSELRAKQEQAALNNRIKEREYLNDNLNLYVKVILATVGLVASIVKLSQPSK